ncbi:MAG: diguanylate cyclase [Rhodospirillaceae bacterium]|nr:diguanylate cyclase [Rhodospirillaceae bacterium]MBT5245471.1 diguanylate cyclase [Rhodospirillaceae bacterium]MBT5562627.1 diguanylate cyclase [Rhodospirillaceae bacterium]MBT6242515.1 diguanylate cyclase [Rhodospirillaceae bacterium]MBT7136567.1 diguanylate cyclase [Rhodospirillaceae bacterium]
MSRLANVLIAGSSGSRLDDLAASLSENGFQATRCTSATGLLEEARIGQPDLALIDLASADLEGMELAAQVVANPDFGGMPVVVFGADGSEEQFAQAVEAGIDDIFTEPATLDDLRPRLIPLLRLATMRRELTERLGLANRFGASVEPLPPLSAQSKLELLQIGRDLGEVEALKKTMGDQCAITTTPNAFTANLLLSSKPFFDACFLAIDEVGSAVSPEQAMDLCNQIRLSPRLYNMPVVLINPHEGGIDISTALQGGATRVLSRRAEDGELSSTLSILGRRQQSRWLIRQSMLNTKTPETTDPRTGAYTFEYMRAHLESLVAAARIRDKHLTLVFFSFPDAPGVKEQFGEAASEHLLKQLPQWINAMVRVEDMVAHYTGHDFCIALPDTPLEEALFVMNRIAGVLAYTDFALDEVYQPVSISVEYGIAEIEKGDTIDALIDRAHANLD